MKHDLPTQVGLDDRDSSTMTAPTADQFGTASRRPSPTTKGRSKLLVAGVAGAAALLAGAGVVAIRQLSTPALEGDAIAAPGGATPVTGPAGTSPEPSNPAPAAVPDDGLAGEAHTRPAEYVDLDYTWAAYAADSPEVLALRFNPKAKYAFGTADGPDGTPVTALYAQTDEGWQAVQPIEADNVAIVGDSAYVVDYDDQDDYRETLRAYDIASDSWSDVALPDEATNALPGTSDALVVNTTMEISSTDDALLVAVGSFYSLDSEALNLDESSEVSVNEGADGTPELVATDFDCVDRISSETMEETLSDDETLNLYAECEQQVDPQQYGLTEQDLARLNDGTNSYWLLVGGAWQRFELPDDGSYSASLRPGGVLETYAESGAEGEGAAPASRFYAFEADGSVEALFGGTQFVPTSSEPEYQPAQPVQRVVFASGAYLMSQDVTSTDWAATDLNALGDGPGWGRYGIAPNHVIDTANGGVLALGTVTTNLPAEPTELTSGDYTIRFEPGSIEPTITNNATGEQVIDAFVSTESGKVDLARWDGSGDEVTLASFDTDWTDVPALNTGTTSAVLASTDGVRFGVVDAEDLIEILGAGTDTHLVLDEIHESDGKIVVSGALLDRYGEDVGADYVFVGTPN